MPRDNVMDLMKRLKFVAMPKVYDEVLAAGRKRRQTHETVIEELLQVEVAERRARSIPVGHHVAAFAERVVGVGG